MVPKDDAGIAIMVIIATGMNSKLTRCSDLTASSFTGLCRPLTATGMSELSKSQAFCILQVSHASTNTFAYDPSFRTVNILKYWPIAEIESQPEMCVVRYFK